MKIRDLGMLNMPEEQNIEIVSENGDLIWGGKVSDLMDIPSDISNRDIKVTQTAVGMSDTFMLTSICICFTVFDNSITRKHKLIKTYSVNMRGRRCMYCHSIAVDYTIGLTGKFLCKNCKISKYGDSMEVEL